MIESLQKHFEKKFKYTRASQIRARVRSRYSCLVASISMLLKTQFNQVCHIIPSKKLLYQLV